MLDDTQEKPPSPKKKTLDQIRAEQKALRSKRPSQTTPKEGRSIPSDPLDFVTGFGENVARDAYDLLKGLFVDLPVGVVKGVGALISDPGKTISEIPAFAGSMVEALIEPYQKHGFKVLYYRPVTTALDALAGWGVAAKSLGMAAKVSGSTRGLAIARKMEDLPRILARQGVDKLGAKMGKDLPARREFLHNVREANADQLKKYREYMEGVGKKVVNLTPEERSTLHKWIRFGTTKAEAAANPKVSEALESWRSLVESVMQIELKDRGLLDDLRINETVIQKMATEMPGGMTKENIAKARQMYEAAEIKPVYAKSSFEKVGEVDDFFEFGKEHKRGAAGFLEKFTGQQGAITDPSRYIPESIKAFTQVERDLRLIEQVIQHPEWTKAVKAGDVAMKDLLPSRGVFSKYFEDKTLRAQAKGVAPVTKDVGAGKLTPEAAVDAVTKKRVSEAANIFVANPTIQKMLKYEFMGRDPGTMMRFYDKITRMFTTSATKLNPQWYTGNIVGDALMSALFGGQWKRAKQMIDAGAAPIEASAKVGMSPASLARTGVGKKIERAAEAVGVFDDLTRMSFITPEAGRRMVKAVEAGEMASTPLQTIMKSTENFNETQVRLQLVQEGIAKRSKAVQKIDRLTERLAQRKELLKARVGAGGVAMEFEGTTLMNKRAPKGPKMRGYDELEVIEQRLVNLQEARSRIVADLTDDFVKAGKLEEMVPGLRQQAEILRASVDYANTFVGEYLGLSGIEREVFKRIFPFYAWSKAMTMLAYRLPFIAPVKTFLWHRFGAAMMSMYGDEELPEYAQGYIPVFAFQDGSQAWVKMSSFNPASGTKPSSIGGVPIPGNFSLLANPIFRLAYSATGGRTVFDTSNIPYGEKMVNMYNGDVYEYTGRGTVRKVIAQPPLISGIAHMFPVTQFVEDLITPLFGYQATDRSRPLLPRPVLKPDGSYRYPAEWWQSVAKLFGVPVANRDRDEIIRGEKIRVRKAIEALRGAYGRSGPDQRQYIREAMNDYSRGEYRRLED